ncbi:hypothetical protein HGA64_02740 [Candidatus Falkowbacteria bacterium]|nr:hypothetical protein [Candidatus Falkowbacteria bacterium]
MAALVVHIDKRGLKEAGPEAVKQAMGFVSCIETAVNSGMAIEDAIIMAMLEFPDCDVVDDVIFADGSRVMYFSDNSSVDYTA